MEKVFILSSGLCCRCDDYLNEIQTLRVHLLAANDGGLAPVESASACIQTSTIETPRVGRRQRSMACGVSVATSPVTTHNRRKSCVALLNDTIGALNRTAAVAGLPMISQLDAEDNVSFAEVIGSLKNELLILQDRLEKELPVRIH